MDVQAVAATVGDALYPQFVPEQVSEIQEEAALSMIGSIERCRLDVPSLGPVDTAFVEEGSGDFLFYVPSNELLKVHSQSSLSKKLSSRGSDTNCSPPRL